MKVSLVNYVLESVGTRRSGRISRTFSSDGAVRLTPVRAGSNSMTTDLPVTLFMLITSFAAAQTMSNLFSFWDNRLHISARRSIKLTDQSYSAKR
jgi:hypothetical protein